VDRNRQAALSEAADQGCSADGAAAGAEPAPTDDAAALIQLSGLVQQAFARAADRHDLTPVQARLLCALAVGPRGMAELARGFGVEKAALTGLVDRVERRGLAERAPVPGDRRVVHVMLTETGRRSAAAFHAEVTAELNRLLTPLTPHDREHLSDAIAKIAEPIGQPAGRGPCRPC
jgi:DNA-binding MarR family transcriptional regulator